MSISVWIYTTGSAEGPSGAMAAPGFEVTAMVLVKRVLRIPLRMKAAPPVQILKRKGFNDSQKGGGAMTRDPASMRGGALLLAKQVQSLALLTTHLFSTLFFHTFFLISSLQQSPRH